MSTDYWWQQALPVPDMAFAEAAGQRQLQLTKPPGSLGQLEQLAAQLAACQQRPDPQLQRVRICVFAGDHGVVAEGVSAFPQSVTASMLANFAAGGAAISVLADEWGAELRLVNLGLVGGPCGLPGVEDLQLMPGTDNFAEQPAMPLTVCLAALQAGREQAQAAAAAGCQLLIGGEMGIGNTSSACALASALLQRPVAELVGPGTGLQGAALAHKAAVIERALALHGPALQGPLDALQRLGGLEIAALAGAFLGAAEQRLAVLVDGYITTAAALCAVRLNPQCRPWLLFSHRSAEPGHAALLQALQAQPLLDLGMRLGEGSGAAVALPILRSACALHNRMATFAEAGVAGPDA